MHLNILAAALIDLPGNTLSDISKFSQNDFCTSNSLTESLQKIELPPRVFSCLTIGPIPIELHTAVQDLSLPVLSNETGQLEIPLLSVVVRSASEFNP